MPKALLDRPALKAQNRPYLEAFYELSSGRSMGESMAGRFPQPLSVRDLLDYAERVLGLPRMSDALDTFLQRLRQLDLAYLTYCNEEAAKAAKSAK